MDKLIDKTKEFYNQSAQAYLNRNFHRVWTKLLRQFISYLPELKTVLDIGCSVGRDLMWLRANGVVDVYGVDFAQEMIDIAKNYVDANLRVMDITRGLKFDKNTFNGIICLGTLGNISKKKAPFVVKELYRILKPGGVTVITVKEGDREYLEVTNKYGLEYMNLPRQISLYQPTEFNQLLKSQGFEVFKSLTLTDDNFNWVVAYSRKPKKA